MDAEHTKKRKRRFAPHRGTPAPSHLWAASLSPAGINPPALVGFYLSRSGMSRNGRAMNFDKIPKNSINIAKFTGFFDKLLKIIFPVNDCNSKVYLENMSDAHSDPAAKKISSPAHFPATARICVTG